VKKVSRSLHLVSAAGTARKETYKGRDYIVSLSWPWSKVSSGRSTRRRRSTLLGIVSMAPESWNGRPSSGSSGARRNAGPRQHTEILESEQFGIVFNAGIVDTS
jgi:hypothetical protein